MIPFADAAAAEAAEFITTRPLPDGDTRSDDQLLLALDCEMCRTTKGVELTRITLVDSKENVRSAVPEWADVVVCVVLWQS